MDYLDKITVSKSGLTEVMGFLDGIARMSNEEYEQVIDEAREKLRQVIAEAEGK